MRGTECRVFRLHHYNLASQQPQQNHTSGLHSLTPLIYLKMLGAFCVLFHFIFTSELLFPLNR